MSMDKKKLAEFTRNYINQDNIQFVLLAIPMVLLFIKELTGGEFSINDIIDTTLLVTFLLAIMCKILADFIVKRIMKYCEDASKLTVEYDRLNKKYCRENLIRHKNTCDDKSKVFPVIPLVLRKESDPPFDIVIDNTNAHQKYELPKQIADRSDYIMKAHSQSKLFNNINVRLSNLTSENGRVTLHCSKTTYFDSMITNRAMDYSWENGKTTREVFEPGPFVSPLSESRMSNHLGFNGFVETSDGRIIFVIRDTKLSIGKGTLADSIGAAMKAKYCLDSNEELTVNGLYNAIAQEINDELKIKVDLSSSEMQNSIFAFYRDLVEGGKPQFLFYLKLNSLTAQQFLDNYSNFTKKDRNAKKNKDMLVDGHKFELLSLDDLRNSQISADSIVIPNGKKYAMMPSASAAIVMLLDFKA